MAHRQQNTSVGNGLCEPTPTRLSTEYAKNLPAPRPLRHPRPAHAHTSHIRPTVSGLSFGGAINAGFQTFPGLAMAPIPNAASGIAFPTPIFPYPGMPLPPLTVASQNVDLRNAALCQNVNRSQVATIDAHKIKTPINRNYLELAMLVCNTFRGKLFPCPHCRYVTDRRNNLKRHVSTMHQACEKLLECCGVSFSTKASLREHIMIFHHNGYSCPYCGRRFCRKALLKRHLSVHSGQKDYTCPNCDYATSHKSNLERHKRIHERLKLGDDGSFFSCSGYPSHPDQSPDTTDNSCIDNDNTDDNCIDVDTTDESCGEIEVTEDTSENDGLYSYPVYVPRQMEPYSPKSDRVDNRMEPYLHRSDKGDNRLGPYLSKSGKGDNRMEPYSPKSDRGDNRMEPYLHRSDKGDNRMEPYLQKIGKGDNRIEQYSPTSGRVDNHSAETYSSERQMNSRLMKCDSSVDTDECMPLNLQRNPTAKRVEND